MRSANILKDTSAVSRTVVPSTGEPSNRDYNATSSLQVGTVDLESIPGNRSNSLVGGNVSKTATPDSGYFSVDDGDGNPQRLNDVTWSQY